MVDDAFLDRLSRDLRPVRVRRSRRDAALLLLLCFVELALASRLGLMRPDMGIAMTQPSFWWKLGSLGVIAFGGAAVSILSFEPAASPARGIRWLMILIVACLACGGLIDAMEDWRGTIADVGLVTRLDWHGGLQCAAKMIVLSVPALLGLGLLMRRGAASHPGATSLAVGLTASAWGAFVFVFACPHDDPLYIAVWYLVGCGSVTILARWMLPMLTRW